MFQYIAQSQPAAGDRECTEAAILIAPKWPEKPRGRCLFINAETLRRQGALAIRVEDGAMRVESRMGESQCRRGGRRRPIRSGDAAFREQKQA